MDRRRGSCSHLPLQRSRRRGPDASRPRACCPRRSDSACVPTLIMAGRALQLVAGIALVIGWHERIAALLLALFLIPATLTAHDFWASPGPEFQGQLVNFLKNLAMFGGLCFVAFRLPTAAGAHSDHASEEGSVMRATSA